VATGSILLTPQSAILPDGSASNLAPGLSRVKSSAGAPSPYFYQLLFDAAATEQCMWAFRMPADYSSAPVLKVQYKMASATTAEVVIEGRVAAVTDGDAQDVDANGFGTANASAATTVPGTAGHLDEISLTLTNNDSLAAGDFTIVYLARLGADAGDDAAGDMEVIAVTLEYTTA
jgi:hypothetical protein